MVRIPDFMLYIPPARRPHASPADVVLTPGELRNLPLARLIKILWGQTYGKALILCKDIGGLKRRSFISLLIASVRAGRRTIVDDRQEIPVTHAVSAHALGHIVLDAVATPFALVVTYLSLILLKILLYL